MKTIGIILLTVIGLACTKRDSRIYDVNCEDPYYKGKAVKIRVNKHGTRIKTSSGKIIVYGPSVKCEVIHQ